MGDFWEADPHVASGNRIGNLTSRRKKTFFNAIRIRREGKREKSVLKTSLPWGLCGLTQFFKCSCISNNLDI